MKEKKIVKNIAYIVTMRKEGSESQFEDEQKIGNCSQCNEEVIYGDTVIRQSDEKKDTIKKLLCNVCYKDMPRFGKVERPNQETLQKLRDSGTEIDEVKLREFLRKFKNKEFD